MNNMQKSFKRKSALRCMANGGAVYKSEGPNGVPIFSDQSGSGEPYTPMAMRDNASTGVALGGQLPAQPPANEIGPPTSLAPPPAPAPPPPAKLSPMQVGPKSNYMANTGGFGPTPAPVQYKPQDPYAKMTGKPPVAIGAPPVSAGTGLRSAGSVPRMGAIGSTPSNIGRGRAEIGAGRAEIGARSQPIGMRRQPIGAAGYPLMTTMASGGPVRGPGGPTEDKVPAMLSAGEYVLPADTVRKVGKKNLDKLRMATHEPTGNKAAPKVGLRKYRLGGEVKPLTEEEQQNPQLAGTRGDQPVATGDPRVQGSQLAATKSLLQGQPMPPPPATKFVEVPPVPVEKSWAERGAEHQMAEWKASQVVPPGESPMGALGRNLRGAYRATTAPFRDYGDGSSLSTAVDKAAGQFTAGLSGEAPPSSVPKANEIGPPAPGAPAPAPAPAPGGTSALAAGVTQRPDGIYQQGNSYTNVLGADGKPQFLQERVGPPSPASEALLARTPDMQFGPIPSGPGSSLRGGRGGGMRLNMPSAQDSALRGINARFDKMAADYAKSYSGGNMSKKARTLADIEQARTNALNGVMGNDTNRRGQDMAASSAAARDAAGLAQEGMRGQFDLLSGQAAASAAAQKAQAERDREMETGTAKRIVDLFGEEEGLGVHQAYTANQGLIQSMLTPGADGSINVREQDRMSGALHAVLKAAGQGPNTQIVDIVNTPDNNSEAGPTGSPWFDLTVGDAYEIKFANGKKARVKVSDLEDNPDAESFLNQWQRRKAQQAKGAK